MALPLTSIALFTSVVLAAGAFTVSGINFTADTIAKVAASTPIKAAPIKPNYVVRLPTAAPDDLNIAKSMPVKPMQTAKVVTPSNSAVAPAELAVSPTPPSGPEPLAGSTFTHKVAVDALRVRSGPKKSFPQVFTLRGGEWVNTSESVRGWVRIKDQNGREGWVFGGMLQAGTPPAQTQTQNESVATTW